MAVKPIPVVLVKDCLFLENGCIELRATDISSRLRIVQPGSSTLTKRKFHTTCFGIEMVNYREYLLYYMPGVSIIATGNWEKFMWKKWNSIILARSAGILSTEGNKVAAGKFVELAEAFFMQNGRKK